MKTLSQIYESFRFAWKALEVQCASYHSFVAGGHRGNFCHYLGIDDC